MRFKLSVLLQNFKSFTLWCLTGERAPVIKKNMYRRTTGDYAFDS